MIENYHIGVVSSFGYFVPGNLIESLPLGAINVHPSLLPKYRGASPIQSALMNGDEATGVSIIEVHKKYFDQGDILHQVEVPLPSSATYSELHDQLAALGGELILETLLELPSKRLHPRIQSAEEGSIAHKITSSTGKVEWDLSGADVVYNLWRAIGESGELHTHLSIAGSAPQRLILRKLAPPLPSGACTVRSPSRRCERR